MPNLKTKTSSSVWPPLKKNIFKFGLGGGSGAPSSVTRLPARTRVVRLQLSRTLLQRTWTPMEDSTDGMPVGHRPTWLPPFLDLPILCGTPYITPPYMTNGGAQGSGEGSYKGGGVDQKEHSIWTLETSNTQRSMVDKCKYS